MAEEIREQVSDILQHHLSDPRLAWVEMEVVVGGRKEERRNE